MQQLPERHIECGECKKPIHTIYTEIVGKTIYRIAMCADCPILRQKLYGTQIPPHGADAIAAGLCCGNCQTTADEIKMGAPLGCSLCYDVFDDMLSQEIATAERLGQKLKASRRPTLIHLGRRPGQTSEINPALKLLALHQALHETLAKEDYESAAWLRDQIKALTDDNQKQSHDETTK